MKGKFSSKAYKESVKRLKSMSDEDIDLSDMPQLDQDFFKNAELRLPHPKDAISLRLDYDLLQWFKKQGRGYQTRINSVLRFYAEAHGLKKPRL